MRSNLGEEPISNGFSLKKKFNTMSSVQRKSPVFMGSILKKNLAQHHELNFKEEPNPYRFIK
jgi:hypothetical protein